MQRVLIATATSMLLAGCEDNWNRVAHGSDLFWILLCVVIMVFPVFNGVSQDINRLDEKLRKRIDDLERQVRDLERGS